MAKKVVLAADAVRQSVKMGGALSTTPAADLGAIVIREALNGQEFPPDQVDQVYMGCVIQAGLGQNVARQASIKAGIPVDGSGHDHQYCLRFRTELREHGGGHDSGRRGGYRSGRRYGEHVHGSLRTEKCPLRIPHGQRPHDRYHGKRRSVGCVQ